MRISTSQMYANTTLTMDNQQSQLTQLEQQMSTGSKLSTPADNPLGAAQAVQLSQSSAALTQYASNQATALSSLQLEDSTLGNVTTVLQQVNSLIQEAGNGTLADNDRAAIAKQMQGARDQLLTYANTTDGTGNYIFSGFQANTPPFTNQSGGGVQYAGDSGTRQVQVSDTAKVSSADNGASVFMSVLPGLAQPVPAGNSNNTGTGTIGPVTISTAGAASNSVPYQITFGTTGGVTTYSVDDTSTTPPTSVSSNLPYTDGAAIDLGGGMNVSISGTPVAGDTFTVTPAAQGNTDVFSTIDTIISALQTPVNNNSAASATLTNALATASTELANSQSNITTLHAAVGGREQELNALQTMNSTQALQNTNDLANLTTVDMASAISQFTLTQTALSAAQKSFAAAQGLSLFNVINP